MTSSLPPEIEVLRAGGPQTWVVGSHMHPDGDTLGSGIAMKVLLRAMGHRVFHVCPDPVPEQYRFLRGTEEVLTSLPEDLGDGAGLVTCDAADFERFGRLMEPLKALSPLVNVDHHRSNPGYGQVNVIWPSSASTGEVVFHMFQHFGVPLDRESADALYVAVVTDTGNFAYEATSSDTHRLAAELIRNGVSPSEIHHHLHENVPHCQLLIQSQALAGLRLMQGGRLAWTEVTLEMLAQAGAKAEHTDGIAESLRSLQGVEVSCFWRETPGGGIKVSLRSKGAIDVASILMHFGGGGHARAAGCTLSSREEATRLLNYIESELVVHA